MKLNSIFCDKYLLIITVMICFTSLADEISIMPEDIRSCPPLTGPAQFCDVTATNITLGNNLCVGGASNFGGDSVFEGDVIINGTLTVTGITGVTGCNTALCAYGYIYNDDTFNQDIPNGGAVTFNADRNLVGISHVYFPIPSSEIILEQAGVYSCTFILQLSADSTFQLKKNGEEILGSTYKTQTSSPMIGEVIFPANAGDRLQLVNFSGSDVTLVGGRVNASITLKRLA